MGYGSQRYPSEREELLARFLIEPTCTPIFGERRPQPAVRCLNLLQILVADDTAPNGQRWIYPQSHHIRAVGREDLREIEPDDDAYKRACDRFEYLASLVAMDDPDQSGRLPWAGDSSSGDKRLPLSSRRRWHLIGP